MAYLDWPEDKRKEYDSMVEQDAELKRLKDEWHTRWCNDDPTLPPFHEMSKERVQLIQLVLGILPEDM